MKLTTMLASAGKSLGIAGDLLKRDVRDLLMNARPTIFSRELGLAEGAGKKAYTEAIQAGKGVEFLQEKLASFNRVAEEQNESLGGTFIKLHNIWDMFAADVSRGMGKELQSLNKDITNLFDFNNADLTGRLQPLIGSLNTIGKFIGHEIASGFRTVVDWAEEFSDYLEKDQSLVNGFIALWNSTKEVLSQIGGITFEIWKNLGEIASTLLGGILPSTEGVKDNISGVQAITITLTGFVSALGVAFGVVKDTIQGAYDLIKLIPPLIADIISSIGKIQFTPLASATKWIEDKLDVGHGVSEKLSKISEIFGNLGKIANDKIQNNETIKSMNEKGPFAGFFHSTSEQALKGAENIQIAASKMKTSVGEMNQLSVRNPFQGLTGSNVQSPTDLLWQPNESHDEKKKKGGGNPEKTHFNDMIKMYESLMSVADKSYTRLAAIEKEKLAAMEISTQEYFDKKKELLEQDISAHVAALNAEQAETEKYLKKKLSDADRVRAQDKLNEIKQKQSDFKDKAEDERSKLAIERRKAEADVQNKLNGLEAQYLALVGQSLLAEEKKINLKYDELEKNKDITGEMREHLKLMRQEELSNVAINDAKRKQQIYTDAVANAEAKVNFMKNQGYIGEIDAMAQIQQIRQQNFQRDMDNLNAEIAKNKEKLDSLTKNGASDDAIQEVQNKIDGLNLKVSELKANAKPLEKMFSDIFQNGFSNFIDDIASGNKTIAQSFKSLIKGIEGDLMRLVMKNYFKQILGNLGSGGAGGGGDFFGSIGKFFGNLLGSSISGAHADGGLVLPSDKPILVGERGPEIWQPSGSGRIINNNDSSRVGHGPAGHAITVIVNARDAQSFHGSEAQIAGALNRALSHKASRVR
jgi:hypothetical protein